MAAATRPASASKSRASAMLPLVAASPASRPTASRYAASAVIPAPRAGALGPFAACDAAPAGSVELRSRERPTSSGIISARKDAASSPVRVTICAPATSSSCGGFSFAPLLSPPAWAIEFASCARAALRDGRWRSLERRGSEDTPGGCALFATRSARQRRAGAREGARLARAGAHPASSFSPSAIPHCVGSCGRRRRAGDSASPRQTR